MFCARLHYPGKANESRQALSTLAPEYV